MMNFNKRTSHVTSTDVLVRGVTVKLTGALSGAETKQKYFATQISSVVFNIKFSNYVIFILVQECSVLKMYTWLPACLVVICADAELKSLLPTSFVAAMRKR